MTDHYFELRNSSEHNRVDLATDVMRHLHARQYLGKGTVICHQPAAFMAEAHKHWLKLARTLQQQRSLAIDAEKILKYTHTITHMQHLRFTDKTPLENPEADVYFLQPDQLGVLPVQCYSVYVNAQLDNHTVENLLRQLPADALIVTYKQATIWNDFGCISKQQLDAQVTATWQAVQKFLAERQLAIDTLFDGQLQNIEAMDNALDTLLAHSHRFIRIADDFCRALELARPMRLSRKVRRQYDMLMLLAHRVHALSSNSFTQRFLETYNEDDNFFLYDAGRRHFLPALPTVENLAAAIAHHQAAGRVHLAHALSQAAQTKPVSRSALATG